MLFHVQSIEVVSLSMKICHCVNYERAIDTVFVSSTVGLILSYIGARQ